ncbi:MAG: diguanylate cyclase [Acidobacteriota bacterium]
MGEDKRILVVERDPPESGKLRSWLTSRRYRILSASTGKEALRQIRRDPPDLVLLLRTGRDPDVLEVARRLRRTNRYAGVPIIMATRRDETRKRNECFEAGVDDFITRPFRLDEVEFRIQTMLKKGEVYQDLQKTNLRLKEANLRLKKLLVYDDKTRLFNYRHFMERIEEEFKRAERYENILSCVMLDLDRFKRVNDRHGHPEGDKVLIKFGAILMENTRETDLVARYGGEEFAIVLPQTDGRNARIVAERIRKATETTSFVLTEGTVRMTNSAGIATFPANSRVAKPADLIKFADDALYRAKDSGRNRTVLDRGSNSKERAGPGSNPAARRKKKP